MAEAALKPPQLLIVERGRDGVTLEGRSTGRGGATLLVQLKTGDYLDGMTAVGITLTPIQARELAKFLSASGPADDR
jgi:hypothetical protein